MNQLKAIRTKATAVLALTTFGAAIAGCGSPTADQAASPGTQNPAPTPLTAARTTQAKDEAMTAYLGMWRDMMAAGLTSDWKSERLSVHATGDALLVISKSLYTDHLNGVVTKGSPRNAPTVESVDSSANPTTVMINDCGDDSSWLKYKKDGSLVDDAPGGRSLIRAEVKRSRDGQWRVTRFAMQAVGSC